MHAGVDALGDFDLIIGIVRCVDGVLYNTVTGNHAPTIPARSDIVSMIGIWALGLYHW